MKQIGSGNSSSGHGKPGEKDSSYLLKLTLTALGIVYGDIGTSPLYAVRECFKGRDALAVNPGNILGVLSLVFWSLVIVISFKYLVFVMRADNRGEGGILALMTLGTRAVKKKGTKLLLMTVLGIFGAALLYGDGMITPAISVLSAIEGLNVATNFFEPYVIPIALIILISLFLFQRHGTAGIGAVFGPVMLVWFSVLAILGIKEIVKDPKIFMALNPKFAIHIFATDGWRGFVVLGTVFLVVTGGEALYADMGHFGRKPIQLGWFSIVFPALLLNYFGQGALLLDHPEAVDNLFYKLAPSWALYPLVVLATMATIIASQAVISGSFSLTRQAMQLGYSPRLTILHTSREEIGQVYVPSINWALLIGTVSLVIGFKHSGNLAAAYGIAVSATMVITTILVFEVAHNLWNWPLWKVLPLTAFLIVVDMGFFSSNITKIASGGWVPIMVALGVFILMTTWKRGRELVKKRIDENVVPLKEFLKIVEKEDPYRVPGTAIFLTGNPVGTPFPLIRNFNHNKIIHENIILLHVRIEEVPFVRRKNRSVIKEIGEGFYRVILRYGFSEHPNIFAALHRLKIEGVNIDPSEITFFLGRETLLVRENSEMKTWRKNLFAFLSRNARDATRFFRIPPDQVIEIGVQIEL